MLKKNIRRGKYEMFLPVSVQALRVECSRWVAVAICSSHAGAPQINLFRSQHAASAFVTVVTISLLPLSVL